MNSVAWCGVDEQHTAILIAMLHRVPSSMVASRLICQRFGEQQVDPLQQFQKLCTCSSSKQEKTKQKKNKYEFRYVHQVHSLALQMISWSTSCYLKVDQTNICASGFLKDHLLGYLWLFTPCKVGGNFFETTEGFQINHLITEPFQTSMPGQNNKPAYDGGGYGEVTTTKIFHNPKIVRFTK